MLNELVSEKLRRNNPLDKLKTLLTEEKHPYGLLLMSSTIASTGSQIGPSGLSSSSIIVENSSDTRTGTTGKILKDLSSAGAMGLSISGQNPESSLSVTGMAMSLLANDGDEWHLPIASLLFLGGSSAGSDPNFAATLYHSFEFTTPQVQAGVLPFLAKFDLANTEIDSPIKINENKLQVGSIVANILTYNGKEPYMVNGSKLNEPYVVYNGDKLLILHVNQGPKKLSQMEPIARVKAIRNDFSQLCELLKNPEDFDLNDKQLQLMANLQNAPMIGVSHLARLISAKGLPTWSINMLPKLFQKFHTLDSWAVSKLFGGKSKPHTDDIQVMFLPASMRNALVK